MSELINVLNQTESAAALGAPKEQLLEVAKRFDRIVNARIPQSTKPEYKTTSHDLKGIEPRGPNPSCMETEFERGLHITLSTSSHNRKQGLKRTRFSQNRRVVFISLSNESSKRRKAWIEHRTGACQVLLDLLKAERDFTISVVRPLPGAAGSKVVATFTAAQRSRFHAAEDRH